MAIETRAAFALLGTDVLQKRGVLFGRFWSLFFIKWNRASSLEGSLARDSRGFRLLRSGASLLGVHG